MELEEEWGHTVRSDTYRHTNTHMETYTPHTHVQEREKKFVKMREDASILVVHIYFTCFAMGYRLYRFVYKTAWKFERDGER